MPLSPAQAQALITMVASTREQEIPCDECLADLAAFVDQELTGKPVDVALQAARAHLASCHDCTEEYHMLHQALKALNEEP